MKEIIETTFYPKIIKGQIKPKVLSLSKLNITEKITNSKLDYFDILTQIKSNRKNNPGNATLIHNFLLNNNRKFSSLRHKLINNNIQTQTALITEPNYNKKNYSYKTFSNNLTFSDSSNKMKIKLRLRKKLKSPKKLINQIIKFEEEQKVLKKMKLFKKRKPMELSDNYRESVEKIKQFNFFNKYPNSNTDYAHNIRAKYYVEKINESLRQEKKSNDKYLQREREKMEEEKESRDMVFCPSLDIQKISKQIKLILGIQNKFNQIETLEHFFDNFENKINFLYDNFKPPNIKNNLTKIKYEDIKNDKKLNLVNRIGNSAIDYLSNAKIKIQRERDEKLKFLMEKDKIKNKYKYYKKLSSSAIYNSKEEIEKIIFKDYYLKSEDDDNDDFGSEKNKSSDEEKFLKKNFFHDKYEKYDKVSIAEPKLRKFYFEKINFQFTSNIKKELMSFKI